jgi:DNA-binding GntR family transcriptional regulator
MNGEMTKTAYAYGKLKDLLLEGQIMMNRIIPTSELAAMIDMGRAPVLEALKRLEGERYVMIIPQKGVMVRDMTINEMRDINDVRIALEGFIARTIAPVFSEEDAAYLNDRLEEQAAAERKFDPRSFIKSDESFHMYLCGKSGNSLLIDVMQHLQGRFFTVGLYILRKPGRMKSTLEEHRRIFKALAARDAGAAGTAMISHIESGKNYLV